MERQKGASYEQLGRCHVMYYAVGARSLLRDDELVVADAGGINA
jgi:hypothetical protein